MHDEHAGYFCYNLHIKINALVIAQFSPEFEQFRQHYFNLGSTKSIQVCGIPETIYVNAQGVAGLIGGMCKAQSAATVSALFSCPEFDFSNALVISTGCSGGYSERVTLGDVVINSALVDLELGHHFESADLAPDEKVYTRFTDFDDFAYFELNSKLVEFAVTAARDVALKNNDEDGITLQTRQKYGDQKSAEVRVGVGLTSDNYWHGATYRKRADLVVRTCMEHLATHDFGYYLTSQCEDNAIATVLRRFGMLSHLLCVRDIVNYDAPANDADSPYTSVDKKSGAFHIGMENNFAICNAIIQKFLHEPDQVLFRPSDIL